MKLSTRLIFCLPLLILIIAAVLSQAGCRKHSASPPPPPEVQVMEVVQKDAPVTMEWIGTLDGMINADIRAQVSGYLLSKPYTEGSLVKKSGLLFEIDPRPFQATLDQQKGQLAQAQAQLGKTELDVKRYTPLAQEKAISQEELDDAIQANLVAKAQVAAAAAAVQQAQLNLDFCKITAPIDGIAGFALANIGDLVGPQGPVLTTMSAVDPIKVYFPISEQEYLAAVELAKEHEQKGERDSHLELELILANGNVYEHKGHTIFADRQVDVKTGTIRVAGQFPNPRNILRPGQYARVRAVIKMLPGALLVPQRAVTELQGIYQVAVVTSDHKVHLCPVQTGERIDSLWVITQGLKPGDQIAVEGLQKIQEGILVTPVPYRPADAGQPASDKKPAGAQPAAPVQK